MIFYNLFLVSFSAILSVVPLLINLCVCVCLIVCVNFRKKKNLFIKTLRSTLTLGVAVGRA